MATYPQDDVPACLDVVEGLVRHDVRLVERRVPDRVAVLLGDELRERVVVGEDDYLLPGVLGYLGFEPSRLLGEHG